MTRIGMSLDLLVLVIQNFGLGTFSPCPTSDVRFRTRMKRMFQIWPVTIDLNRFWHELPLYRHPLSTQHTEPPGPPDITPVSRGKPKKGALNAEWCCTHAHTHAHARTHTHTRSRAHTHTHTHTHAHTNTQCLSQQSLCKSVSQMKS